MQPGKREKNDKVTTTTEIYGQIQRKRSFEVPEDSEDFFEEEDDHFDDMYAYEISDWWEPYSHQYPALPKQKPLQKYGAVEKMSKPRSGLNIKLMDILSDEVVAELNRLTLV